MAAIVPADNDAKKLREEEENLMVLAAVVKQKREELLKAEQALEEAEVTYEWDRLRAYAAADEEATTFAAALDEAIDAFERSLVPQPDFDGSYELYASTDDCGDLSSVESTLDDVLEEISTYRRANLEGNLERSVAMLLLVSTRFQRLAAVAGEGNKANSSTDSTTLTLSSPCVKAVRQQALECSHYDEMRHSLLEEWADTLTDLTSVGEDSALMLRMLASKLGAPFDELGKGSS